MRRSFEAVLFFAALLVIVLFQFRGALQHGHYLYLAVIEDPAARLSLFPWDVLSARQLRSGHFPLWNPYSGTGMPLLANLQSSPISPLKLLYYLFPSPRSLDLMVVLRLALAGTFCFLFCRSLGTSRPGSSLAGICFSLSGYMMKNMNLVHVSSEMWLPLVFLLIHRQVRSRRPLLLMTGSGLVWSLVMIGGNAEAAFYVGILGFFFSLALGAGQRSLPGWMIKSFFGPLLLGGMMAGAQLLPFLEYLGPGWHIHDPGLHLVGRHPVELISSLVAPWLLGASGSHPVQLVSAPYLGIVTLTLALVAAVHQGARTRYSLFFVGATSVLLSIVYYLPPVGFVTWLAPFNRFGNVKFAMAGATFFIAVLAGSGYDLIRRGLMERRRTSLALAVPGIMLLGGGFHAGLGWGRLELGWLFISFIFLFMAGMAVVLLSRGPGAGEGARSRAPGLRRRAALVFIALLCCLELIVNFYGFRIKSAMMGEMVRFRDPALPDALKPVATDPGLARFTGVGGTVHHNLNLIFNQFDLRAFDAMYPERYVRAMAEIEGFDMDKAVENFMSHGWSFDVRPENLGHYMVDMMGVKYVVLEEGIEAYGFDLIRDKTIKVYKNEAAWPRAWVVSARRDASSGAGNDTLPVRILSYTWDRAEMEARGPGRLVVSDTFFPGWQAEVNGRQAGIKPFRELMRSVKLGPGPHRITMTYRPWAFRIGLWLSISSLIAAAAAFYACKEAKEAKRF